MQSLQYHRILLIRARPGTEASRLGQACAEGWSEDGSRLLVFFHGDGVEHAADGGPSAEWRRLAGWHGVVLAVCSGSWSRRQPQSPSAPFVLSSLVDFWNHAIDACEVACFGVGHGA